MNLPVTLLCKNPGSTPEKRMEQALMCATIDGYMDNTTATAIITQLREISDTLKITEETDSNMRSSRQKIDAIIAILEEAVISQEASS